MRILITSRFKLILHDQDLIGEIRLPIKINYFGTIQDFDKVYLYSCYRMMVQNMIKFQKDIVRPVEKHQNER